MVGTLILAMTTLTLGGQYSSNCDDGRAQVQARTAPLHIRLQIVATIPVPGDLVNTIVSTAAAIWAPYNVFIAPTFTLARSEMDAGIWLTLVLSDPPTPWAKPALASLQFTADSPGTVLYASLDRARSLFRSVERGAPTPAALADRYAATLLGRAVAHEIGHYLLRSRAHARAGLMRPVFSAKDATNDARQFRLLPGESLVLESTRERLAGR